MKLDHAEFKFALQTYKTLALTKPVLVAGALPPKSKKGSDTTASVESAFGADVFSFVDKSQAFVAPAADDRRWCGRGGGRWKGRGGRRRGGGWRGRGGSRGSGRPRGARGTERVYKRIGRITTTKLPSLLSLHTEFV